jgi:hypothetical protein
MGIFNKLKSIANSVTGGGAKVSMEITSEPSLSQPFGVRVTAAVDGADLSVKRVYIKVQGTESVKARNVGVSEYVNGQTQTRYKDVDYNEVSFERDFDVAGAQNLSAGQTYTWEAEIDPSNYDMLPTYKGKLARHEWQLQAGLDASGNDPNSDWVNVELYY